MNQLDQLKQFTTVVADTGNFKQLAQFTPRDARNSMSFAEFIVTTSASRPSATERACLLEPSCD